MRFVCTSLLIHFTVYRHTVITAVSDLFILVTYPPLSASAGRAIRVRKYLPRSYLGT
jgi:hypothetical protein